MTIRSVEDDLLPSLSKSNMNRLLVVGILLILCFIPAFTDTWIGLEPTSYVCRGMEYIAEIFPPFTAIDSSEKPLCYFYRNGWKENPPELLWKDTLVNRSAPSEVIISMGGDLVTINDHANLGYQHSVVIYNTEGHLIKTYYLDDLIPKDDMMEFIHSTSSRWWNVDAKYFFVNTKNMWKPTHLYIKLKWGKAMEFRLHDGAYRYGLIPQFPVLDSLSKRVDSNEETAMMATSLRFSSLTQLLDCKNLLKK